MQAKTKLHQLASSFWFSRGCLQAWILLLLVSVCTIILVLLTMLLNKWQASFYNHLQHYNYAGFIDCLIEFLGFSSIFVFTAGYQSYFRMLLSIRWRHWLTNKYVALWLQNQTYYQLNLIGSANNPEQRISEDVQLFITNTVELAVGLLRHTVMLLVFSVILWQMSGIITVSNAYFSVSIAGYLFWLALLYSVAGTWVMVRSGKSLVSGNIAQQSNEAEFRSYLNRIKEHDECVALYGGEATEKQNLTNFFHKIIQNYLCIADVTKRVTVISSAYSQISVVFAFLVASPRYFNQEIQLGQLFEISGAYWYVHSALSYIIESYSKFALWRAVAFRLQSFNDQIGSVHRLAKPQGEIAANGSNHLRLKNLTIYSSAKQILLNDLTLELRPQNKLLISGPSGSGKSTLVRTIAGMWPHFTGKISKPPTHSLMFLPQKPYIPLSSLRDALLYPGVSRKVSDAKLHELLICCNLSPLIGQLDQKNDWGKVLSLGEQQCLSFARVILQRPQWLFLDEATSSLDRQTEERLYSLLEEVLPEITMISVGHRETLRQFHTLNLTIEETGAWYISPITDYQDRNLKTTGIVV